METTPHPANAKPAALLQYGDRIATGPDAGRIVTSVAPSVYGRENVVVATTVNGATSARPYPATLLVDYFVATPPAPFHILAGDLTVGHDQLIADGRPSLVVGMEHPDWNNGSVTVLTLGDGRTINTYTDATVAIV